MGKSLMGRKAAATRRAPFRAPFSLLLRPSPGPAVKLPACLPPPAAGPGPDRRELQLLQHVVHVVVLGEVELHQLLLELQDAAQHAVQQRPQHQALLRLHHLVVAGLEAPRDLHVAEEERRHLVRKERPVALRRLAALAVAGQRLLGQQLLQAPLRLQPQFAVRAVSGLSRERRRKR